MFFTCADGSFHLSWPGLCQHRRFYKQQGLTVWHRELYSVSCDREFPSGPVVRRLGPFTKVALARFSSWSVQFSSVQSLSCVWLSVTPGTVAHQASLCASLPPEACSNSCPSISIAIQPSNPVIPFSSCLKSFPASGSFPRSLFFASGGQRIGVSASTSVLPMNIQDWFPLGLTGWISLQSKGLSRVFSNTTVQKQQFFDAQLSS